MRQSRFQEYDKPLKTQWASFRRPCIFWMDIRLFLVGFERCNRGAGAVLQAKRKNVGRIVCCALKEDSLSG